MVRHMKILLTIVCLVLVSSYSYSEEVSEDQLVVREGVYYKNFSTTPFTGTYVEFYENGQLLWMGNLKDGKQDGLWKGYNEKGQLVNRGNWRNGKQHGLYETFYENGQLWTRSNYKDGELHGLSEQFYENGQLKSQINYN